MRYLLLLSSLLILSAHAQNKEIYRYTDKNGNTVYSDKAPKGSSPITLPKLNTTPAVDTTEPKRKHPKAINLDLNSIQINTPSDGAIIANGLLPTTVTMTTDQALRQGQQIHIRLNGRLVSKTTSTSTSIPRMPRGQQQISAAIIDSNGKTLAESSIRVMVYRPSN
jgi:hypothetical protein